jgi:hypothetical protein
MKKETGGMRFVIAVLPVAAILAVAGCGSVAPTTAASSSTPTAASSPTPTAASSPTPVARSAADVNAAQASALGLFVKIPLNSSDPSAGYVWTSGPASAAHMSAAVRARLAALGEQGYFRDGGGCGEDYITATQNGLLTAPTVSSAIAGATGSVAVTIQRGSKAPQLTAMMTDETGAWLASDLQSGTGPSASIFSAKPNC